MKGLYGFSGQSLEVITRKTQETWTEMLMVEYLGHGETYRERKKNRWRKRGKEEDKERWRRRGRENSGKYNNLSKDDL